jgi:hypothetical protein
MTGTRRILQKWIEGMECTRNPRFRFAIKACKKALEAEGDQARKLEQQAYACVRQVLQRRDRRQELRQLGAISTRYTGIGSLKVKFIFDLPTDAPFGVRPETFFIRLPRRTREGLRILAAAEGLDLAGALREFLCRAADEILGRYRPAEGSDVSEADLPSS